MNLISIVIGVLLIIGIFSLSSADDIEDPKIKVMAKGANAIKKSWFFKGFSFLVLVGVAFFLFMVIRDYFKAPNPYVYMGDTPQLEHNIQSNGEYGMRYDFYISIKHLKDKPCKLKLEFFHANGEQLEDLDGANQENGFVTFSKEFVPFETNFKNEDYDVFIPYTQLHLKSKVKYDLKMVASLYCEDIKYAESQKMFDINLK